MEYIQDLIDQYGCAPVILTGILTLAGLYAAKREFIDDDDDESVGASGIRVVNKISDSKLEQRVMILLDTIKRVDENEYRYMAGGCNTIYIVDSPSDVFGEGFREIGLYGAYCDGGCFLFANLYRAGVKQAVVTMGHEVWHAYNKGAHEHHHDLADHYGENLYNKIAPHIGK